MKLEKIKLMINVPGILYFTTQRELSISSKVARTNEKVLIINYNLVKEVVLALQQIVFRPCLMFLCLTCAHTENNFTLITIRDTFHKKVPSFKLFLCNLCKKIIINY